MPYLDQGEFYGEFGNYNVQITVPADYVVAATGNLQEANEKQWLNNLKAPPVEVKPKKETTKSKVPATPVSTHVVTKTLHYQQNDVHDFAWFADKSFTVKHDSLQLPSGKAIDVYAFHYGKNEAVWKNSIAMIKRAILTKSKWLGEYPYDIVSVVDGGANGGMEYPTITVLTGGKEQMLDFVINHEVGHNWFQGILGTNERIHPWMDEGMNTYYDTRYSILQYGNTMLDILPAQLSSLKKKMPDDLQHTLLQTVIALKKDQPIETPSEKFNLLNYNLVAYVKTGEWMKGLEEELGVTLFDKCMNEYYRRWHFKHPYPDDFKKVMEEVSGKNLATRFALLNTKGDIRKKIPGKDIRITAFFNLKGTDKHNYISLSPAVGYNFYDKFMLGAVIHNYSLPLPKLHFVLAPLYGFKSKQINGMGRIGYTFYPGNKGQNAELSVAGASFSGDSFTDSTNTTHYQRYLKIVPSLRFTFANKNPRSTITKYIQWKTFIIREQGLLFTRDTTLGLDIITYPYTSRYVNQLQFVFENNRVLYPYNAALQAEQGDGFVRLNFTGNYYFNFAKGGGANVRFFAGKFFYTGDNSLINKFNTEIYHLNMTGPKGNEDYTYSNYFIGRNEFEKFSSQQIMIRDGGFKVGTDLLSNKIGKTDDWLMALNFTSDIPRLINPFSVLPFKVPIKLFVDIGTYAGAWKKNAETGRFVYDAGFQLSLFKNVLNIYVPVIYSNVYKNYYKSVFPKNSFTKRITFSIDVQNINLRRFIPQFPF